MRPTTGMKRKRIIHHSFGGVRLAALVVSFLCCTQAQSQTVNSSYKKWLDCDVDWIIGDSTFVAGPEFSIRLSFRRNPITTARLLLGRGWTSSAGFSDMGVVATAETDSEGIARFFAIPPGTYTAIAENGLLFPSSVDIHVRSDVDPGKQETVEWPERTIPARALRGS